MSTPTEKAIAYFRTLESYRSAAITASEENLREAALVKARQDRFREAIEIFGLTITLNDTEEEPVKTHHGRRRDIRQLIIKELSYSGKSMTKHQIAKAIDYTPEGTEAALRRLETAGKVQNRDGYWEVVIIPAVQSNGQASH